MLDGHISYGKYFGGPPPNRVTACNAGASIWVRRQTRAGSLIPKKKYKSRLEQTCQSTVTSVYEKDYPFRTGIFFLDFIQ
jgi:hypothetical protein